jgi:hypothetical protein
MPTVLFQGRVWAEEGLVFLNNAFHMEWYEALFQPHGGYLNLISNIAGLVGAHLISLESVRFVGPVVGILFQVLPLLVAATGTLPWLKSRGALFALVLIIGLSPLHDEVWFNSLHPQYQLTLCTGLILAMPLAQGWRKYFHLSIIGLAALTGPTVWFLLPIFLLRAVFDHSADRMKQALLLGGFMAVQLCIFYDAARDAVSAPRATFALGLIAASMLGKNLINPTLPFQEASWMYNYLSFTANNQPFLLAGITITALILVGAVLWTKCARELWWLYCGGVSISMLSYVWARGGPELLLNHPYSANRYSFSSHVLFALTVLGAAMTSTGFRRNIAFGVLGWTILIGAIDLRNEWQSFFTNGPRWLDEVTTWRQDKKHKVKILPSGWAVALPN